MPPPFAIVTNPPDGGPSTSGAFDWNIQGIYHVSSEVIVGYSPGAADIYPGKEFPSGTYHDPGVHQPGGNATCYTRPRYRKQAGGAWYTLYSVITSFTSTVVT
jgi:hypothetical protein